MKAMTDTDFDLKLRHIKDQYAARSEEANAYMDREIARLFVESKWTQGRIAQRMGKTQVWVAYHLCFGRFIASNYNGRYNTKANGEHLTEWRFRKLWKRTFGKESERFEQVAKMLRGEEEPQPVTAAVAMPVAAAAAEIARGNAERDGGDPELERPDDAEAIPLPEGREAEQEDPPKPRGVGIARANEAINCLIRIPKGDAFRERGFQIVKDWIRRNK